MLSLLLNQNNIIFIKKLKTKTVKKIFNYVYTILNSSTMTGRDKHSSQV